MARQQGSAEAVQVQARGRHFRVLRSPGAGGRPAGAISGRLVHLHSSALGFRKLANRIARSLLKSWGP